jgi:hypothetical protein
MEQSVGGLILITFLCLLEWLSKTLHFCQCRLRADLDLNHCSQIHSNSTMHSTTLWSHIRNVLFSVPIGTQIALTLIACRAFHESLRANEGTVLLLHHDTILRVTSNSYTIRPLNVGSWPRPTLFHKKKMKTSCSENMTTKSNIESYVTKQNSCNFAPSGSRHYS